KRKWKGPPAEAKRRRLAGGARRRRRGAVGVLLSFALGAFGLLVRGILVAAAPPEVSAPEAAGFLVRLLLGGLAPLVRGVFVGVERPRRRGRLRGGRVGLGPGGLGCEDHRAARPGGETRSYRC